MAVDRPGNRIIGHDLQVRQIAVPPQDQGFHGFRHVAVLLDPTSL
jgi:hypothetical protein